VDLANVLWIGGPEGSGSAAVAQALARRHDLQLYLVEDRTAAHAPRMPATAPDAPGSYATTARHRFRLVLEDLRELPDSPLAIVAGPQLFPTSVAAVLRAPDHALFLVPDPGDQPETQRFVYEARDLQLTVLREDAKLEVIVDRAADHFARVISDAGGMSPSRRPTP
jgi:hypothetical protein